MAMLTKSRVSNRDVIKLDIIKQCLLSGLKKKSNRDRTTLSHYREVIGNSTKKSQIGG